MKFIESLSARVVCAIILGGWSLVALADNYPDESRRRHEEGVCVVKVTATAEGNIEDPTVTLSTGHRRLDEACLAAFKGKHIKPAMRDGKAVDSTVEYPITWHIGDSRPVDSEEKESRSLQPN